MNEELQIAIYKAKTLYNLEHHYSTNFNGSIMEYLRHKKSAKLDEDQLTFSKLEAMTLALAKSRAQSTNRPLEAVLMEVEFNVAKNLAMILETCSDPVIGQLAKVVVEEEEEEEEAVCGICQEMMEKGEELAAMKCMHSYHPSCILEWLRRKSNCPLCRFPLQPNNNHNNHLHMNVVMGYKGVLCPTMPPLPTAPPPSLPMAPQDPGLVLQKAPSTLKTSVTLFPVPTGSASGLTNIYPETKYTLP
ncbi:Zinc finger, RING-type [Dillenia turbinata]|uniref:Zinc finger, RING-type n=1 Tax=Dillenia turbinata TaxID=194707 RepID=A0AAN8Z9M2_9MAGN